MEFSVAFANLAQAIAEDRAAVTNLTTANSILTEQVALYANRLSTKEAYIMSLQTAMRNLQGKLKNLKAKMYSLKKSGHFGDASKDNGIMFPKWKIEGQSQHPTRWSTTYFWIHGEGGHPGSECKNKRPGHKAKAKETTRLGGSTFSLPQGL